MRVLILEDEHGVARNLVDLIQELDPSIEVLAILQTVQGSLEWLSKNPKPDLGFFDIRLADGESFELFDQTTVEFPIVFTTAYDEYALRAFKVNSIDYLLKPIDRLSLENALAKYHRIYGAKPELNQQAVLDAIREIKMSEEKKYRRSFLIHHRDQILPLNVNQIAYFQLANEMVFCHTLDQKRYIMDQSLEKIESQLHPTNFFRANRQFLVARASVVSASQSFQRKLKLKLKPLPEEDVLISKAKSSVFKNWLALAE